MTKSKCVVILTPIHIRRRSKPLATVDVDAGFESCSQQQGGGLCERAPSDGRAPKTAGNREMVNQYVKIMVKSSDWENKHWQIVGFYAEIKFGF